MSAQLRKAKKLERFPRDQKKKLYLYRMISVFSPQPQLAAHIKLRFYRLVDLYEPCATK